MSFPAKTDCYGVADSSVEITSFEDGKSAQEVTAQNQEGSVVASEVFGEFDAPVCSYLLKAAVSWEAGTKKLGKVSSYATSHKVAVLKFEIATGIGAAPTIKVSGEQVQDGATDVGLYSLPKTEISPETIAQILWDAFKISGSGCHLQTANYTGECKIVKATKDGDCISFDVVEGKLTAAITVKKVGTADPVVEPGEGWNITAPLACSNPDADYPTFTGTLTKYLTKDVASSQA